MHDATRTRPAQATPATPPSGKAAGSCLGTVELNERDRQDEPAWLRNARRSAATAFDHAGFPTTRDEEWRFTNVAPIARIPFAPAAAGSVSSDEVARFTVPGLGGPVMVFVNGRYARELSNLNDASAGVTLETLSDAIRRGDEAVASHLGQYADAGSRAFTALNTALFEDGAFIRVADGTIIGHAIQLVFLS